MLSNFLFFITVDPLVIRIVCIIFYLLYCLCFNVSSYVRINLLMIILIKIF